MSTTRILLECEAAVLPTTAPATLTKVESSGAAPTNGIKVDYNKLVFLNGANKGANWNFRLPSDYVSGGSVFIKWYADATTGKVVWMGGIAPIIDSTTNVTSVSYNAADLATAVTVPGTSGLVLETSWALTVTNLAAGRFCSLFIGRQGTNASDTSANNANIIAAEFEYTS